MQCSILNGMVFGLSLLFFEYVLLPSLSMIMGHFLSSGEEDSRVWMHVQPVLSALFNMFWVMPIFVLSRIINTIWFQVRKRILKNYYFCVHVLRFLCVSKLEISILFCLCQDNLRHICLSILSALFPQFFLKVIWYIERVLARGKQNQVEKKNSHLLLDPVKEYSRRNRVRGWRSNLV